MGKRSAKQLTNSRKAIARTSVIASSILAVLLVGGPLAMHYLFGMSISPVLSSSMAPYVEPGDLLISMPAKASTLNVGDIITLRDSQSNSAFAHRIVQLQDQGETIRFITKGDANALAEQNPFLISQEAVVPKEVLKLKWLGTPLALINSEQGRYSSVSLLVIANLGLIYYAFQKRTGRANPPNN
ncbi:MAG: signal peptidase I [Rhodoluna sp.]|jgi:signal peptidase I